MNYGEQINICITVLYYSCSLYCSLASWIFPACEEALRISSVAPKYLRHDLQSVQISIILYTIIAISWSRDIIGWTSPWECLEQVIELHSSRCQFHRKLEVELCSSFRAKHKNNNLQLAKWYQDLMNQWKDLEIIQDGMEHICFIRVPYVGSQLALRKMPPKCCKIKHFTHNLDDSFAIRQYLRIQLSIPLMIIND